MVVVAVEEFQRTKVCFNWIPLVLGGGGGANIKASPGRQLPLPLAVFLTGFGCSVRGRPQIGVSDGEVLNSPAWHLGDEK